MNEILIVSGKGGTGKTSITAALASCFNNIVLADCDVDASDLHLVLEPEIKTTHSFISGHEASVRSGDCTGCGRCMEVCRFDAVKRNETGSIFIDAIACEGCGVCSWSCPAQAIDFTESICGQWFFSETRYGPMFHAKLGAAAENSGKLVSEVRFNAKLSASQNDVETLLIDGPPGIGCPVIAAMTGVSYAVIVTEPTLSGLHDMERVLSLAKHFGVNAMICINKYDINEQMAQEIEARAAKDGIAVIGKIPYDKAFTKAQIEKKTVVEGEDGAAKTAVLELFETLKSVINKGDDNEKTS